MARPMASNALNISQLESLLHSRKSDLNELSMQRTQLIKDLKDVESRMAQLGGTPGMSMGKSSGMSGRSVGSSAGSANGSSMGSSMSSGSGGKKMGRPPMASKASSGGTTAGGRSRNAKSLIETLVEVLGQSSGSMKVGDIVDAVLKSGYKTISGNFRGIVNQTLIKERKHFTPTGRGLYKAKK